MRTLAQSIIFGALALGLVFTEAHAYIPHSQTIAARLARNHGRGAYVVEQDVIFRTAGEPIVLRERWTVVNGESMRLAVSAPKTAAEAAKFDVVYKDGRRTAPDLEGGVRSGPVGPEFAEGLEHARSTRGFINALVRAKIVPAGFSGERPKPIPQGAGKPPEFRHAPEPLVRLGRTGGVVTWVFGEPTPVSSPKLNAQAWIEQDAFILRRIRFPTEAEIVSERHSTYANNLKLPRERTVTWGENSALIRVVSVRPTGESQAEQALDPNSINSSGAAKAARLPNVAQVREFYSRFR